MYESPIQAGGSLRHSSKVSKDAADSKKRKQSRDHHLSDELSRKITTMPKKEILTISYSQAEKQTGTDKELRSRVCHCFAEAVRGVIR
jgi:hypothetical protein